MRILSTPSGVHFGLLGERGPSPAPTLFVFANSIAETLGEYFNRCGRILSEQGFISVALDLPCHGEDAKAGEPAELDGWRARIERGGNFVPGFVARASAVLDYLIAERYADPQRIAACGTSRGGFIALQFTAAEPRVGCVAAFGPVTNLLVLREFAGMEAHPTANALALMNIAERLASRPVWLCVGNNDERVSTDSAIRFTRKLVEVAVVRKLPAPVELHVMPTVGHTIHPTAHDEAAAWILAQMREGK